MSGYIVAYEILVDDDKRKQYDMFGEKGVDGTTSDGAAEDFHFNFNDFFENFDSAFGDGGEHKQGFNSIFDDFFNTAFDDNDDGFSTDSFFGDGDSFFGGEDFGDSIFGLLFDSDGFNIIIYCSRRDVCKHYNFSNYISHNFICHLFFRNATGL